MMRTARSGVPILETPRLRLRAHTAADLAVCSALWADPAVTRYLGGRSFTREETWSRLLRYAGHWSLLGFGYWLIEDRATRTFIGEVGLSNYRRAIKPTLGRTPEVGWVLSPAQQGRGYATEAVQAVQRWSHGNLRARQLACLIAPDNLASLRVAARCGFHERLRTTYKGRPTILFDWRPPATASAESRDPDPWHSSALSAE